MQNDINGKIIIFTPEVITLGPPVGLEGRINFELDISEYSNFSELTESHDSSVSQDNISTYKDEEWIGFPNAVDEIEEYEHTVTEIDRYGRYGWVYFPDNGIILSPYTGETKVALQNIIGGKKYYGRYRWFDDDSYSEYVYIEFDYDSLESNIGAKVIISSRAELFAKLNVVTYKTNNINAVIYITDYSNLPSSITIMQDGYKDFGSRVIISRTESSDVGLKIGVATNKDLGAKIDVENDKMLFVKINVMERVYLFDAKINIIQKTNDSIGGQINVNRDRLIDGKINIIQDGTKDFNAKINVSYKDDFDLGAKVGISTISQLDGKIAIVSNKDLGITLYCHETVPDNVIIQSETEENVWQNETEITFFWDEPHDDFSNWIEYYAAFNQDPNYVTSPDDQRLVSRQSIKEIDTSGDWYFHIRAVNEFNNMSLLTSHYHIKFNNLPYQISPGLEVDDQSTITDGSTNHDFSWDNTTDDDQLDELFYDIQIFKNNFDEENRIYEEYDIPDIDNLDRSIVNVDILEEGDYVWRVRASDNKQHTDWTDCDSVFHTVSEKNSVGAKVSLPIYYISNLKGKIHIFPYKKLGVTISIKDLMSEDLGVKINVSKKRDETIGVKLVVFSRTDVSGKINIINYENLNATINVIDVYGSSDVGAKINVSNYYDNSISASIKVCEGSADDFGAKIRIPTNSDLYSRVVVYSPEHYGFIDEFGDNISGKISIIQNTETEFPISISVIERTPDTPVILPNVDPDIWQEDNNVIFDWIAPEDNIAIEACYIKIDQQEEVDANEDNFRRTYSRTAEFDLEIMNGAGEYYFHVASKGINGKWSETAHCRVRYNHIPTTPAIPLTVGGEDCLENIIIVPKNNTIYFGWGASIEVDSLDTITYEVEISNRADFENNELGQSSIVYDEDNINSNELTLNIEFDDFGTYYWRVRASDEHEYSDWSPVGIIKVNSPPQVPSNLIVTKGDS